MKSVTTKLFVSGLILSLPWSVQSDALTDSLGAAPLGVPIQIATKEINKTSHPCPKVTSAHRNTDGSISAKCNNNEDYRIFSLDNEPIVMRCSVVRELGISGC